MTTKRKAKKCANCQGTGTIIYYDWSPATQKGTTGSSIPITDDKPCYRCRGTGKEEVS